MLRRDWSELALWLGLLVIVALALFVYVTGGCAAGNTGFDTSESKPIKQPVKVAAGRDAHSSVEASDRKIDMPANVVAGRDATVIMLGRLSAGGLGSLLLGALLLWRSWCVARRSLKRVLRSVKKHIELPGAAEIADCVKQEGKKIDRDGLIVTPSKHDACERLIRQCLAEMQ